MERCACVQRRVSVSQPYQFVNAFGAQRMRCREYLRLKVGSRVRTQVSQNANVVVGHRHPLCCLPRWATRIQPRSRVDRTCACAYHHTLSVSLPRGIRPRTDLRAADPDRCPLSVKPPEHSSINRSKVAGQASWAGNWGEEGGELSPEGRVASELAWPGAGAVERRVAVPAVPRSHTIPRCVYFSP
ncbi:hypothetical protein VFPFJ_04989 [Purpureocillium lilacinum]|uniref:Uncharacterized protein n=1 Tax=Purpureocillium lilacinum TaxID=33203 RepID=A0A179HN03_PURLI|nr:hypothetical protein VFPFJ_04989 [Purpureocillium lilacinum]OAQ90830.1 hypothetical protein VFPFJ_04989 [Purpureocillium lilacinum]